MAIVSRTNPFYRRWKAPLFKQLGLQSYETAWLPLVKCPLPARTKISSASIDIARDMNLLWDQLIVLKPQLVLIQGAVVHDLLSKRLDNLSFIRVHALQKIPQQPSATMMREQLDTLTRELQTHIDQLRTSSDPAERR